MDVAGVIHLPIVPYKLYIMKHQFEIDFYAICNLILEENKTIEEWAEIESSNMFQEGIYVGGFDGTEMEFTFSVKISGKEYWFQLPLTDISKILRKEIQEIRVTEADN